MRIKFGVLAAVSLLLSQAAMAADDVYKIQPGDTLEVTVLEDPNLNRQVLVRPDGRISLPIAGTVKAEGLSPEGVQSVIRRKLSGDFEILPTVTVSLVGTAEETAKDEDISTVYVLGEARQPGRFAFKKDETLNVLQALALAGGLDRFAAPKRIQVRRVTEDGEVVIPFDFEALEDGGTGGGMEILDGDVIFIPERGLFE